ncbi:MAG: isoprenylcysteine carboxylmethyltransferase family protein [Lachnospiraceae bacterium]|nr:isoprenylcysteine carboxylmethyltransferase family protein [Lachnospiraceae bacterium]
MKNFVNESQKLPMFGIGPYLILGIGIITLIGMILSGTFLKGGILYGSWIILFRIIAIFLMIVGIFVWYKGAFGSNMDESITENILMTKGIYSWVRNPMYSGWWIFMIGLILMFHNAWLLIIPVINWGIMTVVLMNTEEKWLLDLYKTEYEDYKKKVNRCIPFKRQ